MATAVLDAASASAKNVIFTVLNRYGLGSLATWAWNKYLAGESAEQIMLELRDTTQYKARFPAMADLAKSGRAISETDYINYEQQTRSLLHQYGIPTGMYDTPAAIKKLLLADVSPTEMNERLQMAAAATFQVPQEVRDSLQENYAVSPGGLTAYFLDPAKAEPKLQAQYISAQVQAASRMQGVATGIGTAERLASQGVDFSQAMAGFAKVRQMAALTSGYGETADRTQTENAAFGLAQDTALVERVARSRLAGFQAGGGAAQTQAGVTGLGSAAT